jgi:guanylate kinase
MAMSRNIISAMRSGRMNIHHFKLSLNKGLARDAVKRPQMSLDDQRSILEKFPVMIETADLSSAAKVVDLNLITNYFPAMISNLAFLGEIDLQPQILSFDELSEIINDPDSLDAKGSLLRACRESLALHLLDDILGDIDQDGEVSKSINRQLKKMHLDINGLVKAIKDAERKGLLSREETTRVKVLLVSIQKGELWGLHEANGILARIGYRLIFNRGQVSLTKNLNMGKLIILSGPSGTGKGETIKQLKKQAMSVNNFRLTNTRAMRPGESQNEPYDFITAEQYEIENMRRRTTDWQDIIINALGAVNVGNLSPEYAKVIADKMPNPDNPENDKLADIVKLEKFSKKFNAGEFVATALVRTDFQGISRQLFERVHKGENLFIEVDTQLAMQLVFHEQYNDLDAIALMLLPPTAEELISRLVNRNTEDMQRINDRLSTAAKEIETSQRYHVHDFYIDNDILFRTVEEFAQTTGLSSRGSNLWASEDYSGWTVAQAYLDIIKERRRNKKLFPMDPGKLIVVPTGIQIQQIGRQIEDILGAKKSKSGMNLSVKDIISAIRSIADSTPEEEKGTAEYSLALKVGSNDPIHFGQVSELLAAVLYKNLNGAVMITTGPEPDNPKLLAYHHREKLAQITLEPYSPWLISSQLGYWFPVIFGRRSRTVMSNIEGIVIPEISTDPEMENILIQTAAVAWLKYMNPGVEWSVINDSGFINRGISDRKTGTFVQHTFSAMAEMGIPVMYFEDRNEPLKREPWMKAYIEEGMLSECLIPPYDLMSSAEIVDMLLDETNIENKEEIIRRYLSSSAFHYFKSRALMQFYAFRKDVAEGLIREDSDDYRKRIETFKREGLID